MNCLQPTEFLNDTVIDFYLRFSITMIVIFIFFIMIIVQYIGIDIFRIFFILVSIFYV